MGILEEDDEEEGDRNAGVQDVEEEELKIEGAGHSHRNRRRGRGMYKRSLVMNETLEDGKLEERGEGGEEEEEVEKARMLEIAAEV